MPRRRTNFTGIVSIYAGAAVPIYQIGSRGSSWWGLEHAAPVVHAAAKAAESQTPCVVVEAGAHQGTLAILAAKLGCRTFAFEANEGHVERMRQNIVSNGVETAVTVVPGFVDETPPSRRIDTHVAEYVHLLKMDIDGADERAMRGASALFDAQRVGFINCEFNPSKQRHAQRQHSGGANYLHLLHRWGFELFLYGCVPNAAAEAKLARLKRNLRCLTYGNYERKLPRNPYTEKPDASAFARCLFGVTMRVNGSRYAPPANCSALEAQQRLEPADFAAFAAAVREVDLVGRLMKRDGSAPARVAAA